MKLAQYLTANSISQGDFAKDIGVTQVAVCRYANETRVPGLKLIFAIDKATKGKVTVKDWPQDTKKERAARASQASPSRAPAEAGAL